MKPFCINETCPNFLPEDKRGYYKKAAPAEDAGSEADAKATAKKAAPKKSAAKKTATKKKTEGTKK